MQDLFETVETTRARVLVDAIEISSPKEFAISQRNLKWGSGQYVQLSIVQSINEYSGYWLAIRETAASGIVLSQIPWDEPLSCHEELEKIFLSNKVLPAEEQLAGDVASACIRRIVRWMESEGLFLPPSPELLGRYIKRQA